MRNSGVAASGSRWLWISVIGLLLVSVSILCALLIFPPGSFGRAYTTLPLSIRSNLAADYGADHFTTPLAPMQINLIGDVIGDQANGLGDISGRVDEVSAGLQTPVPTVTPTPLWTATPTQPPAGTSTTGPSPTPSHTSAATATLTLTTTSSPQPTATSGPSLTPSKTPSPTASLTPTHTFTPSPTRTPTNTLTPTPTATMTPTPTVSVGLCRPPDPFTGYLAFFTPLDGDTNIAVDTQIVLVLNQPMNDQTFQRNISVETLNRGKAVKVDMFYDIAAYSLTIVPQNPLKTNTTYLVTVDKNVENACGQRQGFAFQFSFTTRK